MFKQILNRLPKKPHKSHDNRDGGNPNSSSHTSTSSRTNNDIPITRSSTANPTSRQSLTVQNHTNNKLLQSQNPKLNGNSTISNAYEALPSLKDAPSSEKQNLFIRKLTLCSVVFDFTDPTKNLKEKEIKQQTLGELVDYVSSANGKFQETVMQEIVKMVSVNIFRRLTPQPRDNKVLETFDGEEEEPCMDPAWPHLHLVYEFILRFVASPETDPKIAKRYIDQAFVLKWLDLFDSEDPREREYLKFVLHRMYGKFMVAERALFLWNNDHIDNLIKQNRKVILPIIFPALERNTKTHWNQVVQSLTLNVRKIFSDVDPQLFEECSRKFKEDEAKKEESKSKREATWKRLEDLAAKRSGGGHEPVFMSQKSIANHISSSG
ncbi:hypothetical protein E3N88_30358 [Mikania micrantha]|uniref:Serine/threonine protein phosphatase 2A regulatory subunit n=1 Tax=Mikania micrantha TaxID=192012 RepID=A0A5N6MPC2_9ASTR|nr:hypothetical protein E3N88_30358 [Mikania micrantha]